MASVDGDHKLSFKELMDEELAKKIQQGYEEEMALYTEPSQEEKDFLLALELSQASFAEEVKQEEPIPAAESDQLSEDYLIALQLQDALNEEERIHLHQLRQNNGISTVQVTTGYEPLFEDSALPTRDESDEDEDYDDYEEYDREYASLQSNKVWNKPNGRVSASDHKEIITKHDSAICGAHNTEILETQIGIECGNMVDDNVSLSNPVFNELNQHAAKAETRRIRRHGKEDRETRESVMDSQTRLLLYKMLNSNLIKEIGGIVSSGKEANVYRATAGEGDAMYAIKIYKTTLNEFKNREEYIKDDYRFRYRFNKQSSRKFIKVWAEKEMENLKRLQKYGVPCPEVINLRKNVLVMSFIGTGTTAAPQLRHVSLSISKLEELYLQLIKIMRIMFQEAKLVHGDLSEYNLLYHKGRLWIIDVAQAVEHEHPNCLTFLRRDCENISKYFTRAGLHSIMTTRELFNYVTDINITYENEDIYLNTLMERCANRTELSPEEAQEEKVFLESYIPRHLDHIPDPFDEKEGKTGEVYHQVLTGLNEDLSGVAVTPLSIDPACLSTPEQEEESEKVWVEKLVVTKAEQRAKRKQAKKLAKEEKQSQILSETTFSGPQDELGNTETI